MTLAEFLERMALSQRTLRYWHERGLVPRPSLKAGEGYGEEHEVRVSSTSSSCRSRASAASTSSGRAWTR